LFVKSFVMTDSQENASDCLDDVDNSAITYETLQVIADDCYKIGSDQYLHSARALQITSSVGYFRYLVTTNDIKYSLLSLLLPLCFIKQPIKIGTFQ
jgi:hypothetical protein